MPKGIPKGKTRLTDEERKAKAKSRKQSPEYKAKAKVIMKDTYCEYKDRFDLKYYFKFSKYRLLMNRFQY
jgi:hypothetical protein